MAEERYWFEQVHRGALQSRFIVREGMVMIAEAYTESDAQKIVSSLNEKEQREANHGFDGPSQFEVTDDHMPRTLDTAPS